MDQPSGCRFSQIYVIIFLISCLILSGCERRPDWSDKDVDFLITQLKSNRFYAKRRWAAYWLGKKIEARDKSIPALTEALLNDENREVRVTAAHVLGGMKPPAVSAIPAMMEALQREDTGRVTMTQSLDVGDLHREVVSALGDMGTEALPALMEVLHSDLKIWPDAGVEICRIDASMQDTVIEAIVGKLNHEDGYIRSRAIYALKRIDELGVKEIDDSFLISVFTKAFNDRHVRVRRGAIYALKNINDESLIPIFIKALSDPDHTIRSNAIDALEEMEPAVAKAAVPALENALKDTSAYIRERAAVLLGQMGREAGSAVPALSALLADSELAVVKSAADALRKIGDPSATPALIQAWENGPRDALPAVAQALGEIAGPSAVPSLLRTLRESEYPDLRIAAALALYQIDPSKQAVARSTLTEALTPDKRILDRIAAALALYQVDASKLDVVMDVLRTGLSTKPKYSSWLMPLIVPQSQDVYIVDGDPRRQAALAIAAIGAPAKEMVPVLVKMCRNHDRQYAALDRAVEDALANIGAPSVSALIPVLENENYMTRDKVSKLLKRIGTSEALRAVEAYEQRKNN
jgi:HEAT repeat protein